MSFEIPQKLYFKIGEVSKLAEVAPHVIRYWETEFAQISPKRANSNQRLYRREDVELILKIKFLLHIKGYTIAGARNFLESDEKLETENARSSEMSDFHYLGQIKKELLQLYKQLQQKK